jgi:hypothetical protein
MGHRKVWLWIDCHYRRTVPWNWLNRRNVKFLLSLTFHCMYYWDRTVQPGCSWLHQSRSTDENSPCVSILPLAFIGAQFIGWKAEATWHGWRDLWFVDSCISVDPEILWTSVEKQIGEAIVVEVIGAFIVIYLSKKGDVPTGPLNCEQEEHALLLYFDLTTALEVPHTLCNYDSTALK